MKACGTCRRTFWLRPRFDDGPEAARFLLAGWACTVLAVLGLLHGNPAAAVAVSVPAFAFYTLGVFA